MKVGFTKLSQHYHCIKSSLTLYKKNAKNKAHTPSLTNVQRPRTYCAKAPHTWC